MHSKEIGLAAAHSPVFTPSREAGAMSRLVNQVHWGSIMLMIMTVSHMGVIEAHWVMSSGEGCPDLKSLTNGGALSPKTQVPRWGLMLQLAAVPPKWVHISCSNATESWNMLLSFFFFLFFSQPCSFSLLPPDSISKKNTHTHTEQRSKTQQ